MVFSLVSERSSDLLRNAEHIVQVLILPVSQ